MALDEYGWTPSLARRFARATAAAEGAAALEPARVVAPGRGVHRVVAADGEVAARPAGRLRAAGEAPAVGDWVVLERLGESDGVIRAVLPRRTRLARKAAGARAEEQVLAANLDAVFLVMGLDGDFNPRRLERLAVVAWESGALPVVVLTKADLLPPPAVAEHREAAAAAAPGMPVFAVSAPAGEGLEPLAPFLAPRQTVVLVGSSGVGKSTLLNRLMGREVMRTAPVRADDDRGRHTTVHRELVRLPNGSLLIDSPGVREVGLWAEDGGGLEEAFDDLAELAAGCRFRDCGHGSEPGCAVRAAVEAGTLDPARLEAYRSLSAELDALERRRDTVAERRWGRQGALAIRRALAEKSRRGER